MPPFQSGSLLELPIEHSPRALIGPLGAGKSSRLRERYKALLDRGIPAEKVVVWVTNRNQSGVWRQYIRRFDCPHGESRISTFRSWVRRELEMNWPLVESSHYLPGSPAHCEPFFCGLSASQQVLLEVTEPLRNKYPALQRCRTPAYLQLIQVLDTYARLVENGIPLDAEEVVRLLDRGHHVNQDSPELHRFIGEAIATYRAFCLSHRLLDYSVQLELFHRVLWRNGEYRNRLQAAIDYLMVDNIEEALPVNQEVVVELSKSCRGALLVRDSNGGLREYLGADPGGSDAIIQSLPEAHHYIFTGSQLIAPAMAAFADALARGLLEMPDAESSPAIPGAKVRVHDPFTLRLQMFKAVERRVFELLDAGVGPDQIAVVAPTVDQLLKYHLQKTLFERHQLLRVLTGSNRIIDYRPVRTVLTFARLRCPLGDDPPSHQDVAESLECLLEIHPLQGARLVRLVFDGKTVIDPTAVAWTSPMRGLKAAYAPLYDWVRQPHESTMGIDRLLEDAFANLYAPRRLRALAPDFPARVSAPAGRDPYQPDDALGVLQIGHLIENARAYRKLAAAMGIPVGEVTKRFLKSIYGGELADTPLIPYNSATAAVTLFTAAKYAEVGPPVSHQIWVDASSPYWYRSSIGEFMNPRILSRHWQEGMYTDTHDRRHQAQQLAHIMQTALLKATETVEVFFSDYGSDGSELTGDLAYFLSDLASSAQGARA